MEQKSVYTKLVANANVANRDIYTIRENRPNSKGYVQVLCITETQYLKMETIIGTSSSNKIDTLDKVIII